MGETDESAGGQEAGRLPDDRQAPDGRVRIRAAGESAGENPGSVVLATFLLLIDVWEPKPELLQPQDLAASHQPVSGFFLVSLVATLMSNLRFCTINDEL